jgi:Pyridoxamine 5'-phosphate oxidase
MPTWQSLRLLAPEIVTLGEERLHRFRVAMLGTLRADGSPRISPVEPYLDSGELLLGVIRRSAKGLDLLRDARCTLHSVIDDPDSGEPELSLRGRFTEVGPSMRLAQPDAWWAAFEKSNPLVGTIELEAASLLRFDLEGGVLSILHWTPVDGVRELRKPYP